MLILKSSGARFFTLSLSRLALQEFVRMERLRWWRMAALVHRLFKVALFIGLFLLSVRYIHTYPLPMPEGQIMFWIDVSRRLGVRRFDNLYIATMVVIDLIVAILTYVAIMKLWSRYHRLSQPD